MVRKRELTAMADVKRLEIMTAERIVHRGVLANFLRTAAGPPLHWLPVAHTPATEALLKQQQADLADWKVGYSKLISNQCSVEFFLGRMEALLERQHAELRTGRCDIAPEQ